MGGCTAGGRERKGEKAYLALIRKGLGYMLILPYIVNRITVIDAIGSDYCNDYGCIRRDYRQYLYALYVRP